MVYREEKRDLFSVDDEYCLAHCISADFKLGAGIAVQFDKRLHVKSKLFDQFPNGNVNYWDLHQKGYCIRTGRVINLVTKRNYWNKPTLKTIREALEDMRGLALDHGIKKIAMPRIGCGLDRLDWKNVSHIVQEVFGDTEIEILVCIN